MALCKGSETFSLMADADSLASFRRWTAFFAVIWVSTHWYSNHCSSKRLLRGAEMDLEASSSLEGSMDGLVMPRPPSLGGRPRRSHSRSFGGDLPVREGMKLERMQFSSGRR